MVFLKSFINYPDITHKILRFFLIGIFIVPSILSGQGVTGKIQQNTTASGQLSSLTPFLDSLEKYKKSNEELPGEKVYLHIDRLNFMQGDTIWFKAYSWYGYDQVPDTVSGVLYVDLINSTGKVFFKRKLLIQNGTSQGDFCLDTTISPGGYTLRAYTRRMGNLNTGEPFYQTISVSPPNQNFQVEFKPVIIKQAGNDSLKISFRFFELDQTGDLKSSDNHTINYSIKIGDQLLNSGQVLAANTKEQVFRSSLTGVDEKETEALFELSIRDNRLTFEKQFQIPLKDGIDLQFFPEGGRLVTGLESKVAFKAIGTDGLSREVKGEIKDEVENVVAGFESTHKGMGAFLLKPEVQKKYFAHLWYNNRKYIIPLPLASEEGSVMFVNFIGNNRDPSLTIKHSPSVGTTQKYIVGSANGKIWFSAIVKIAGDSSRLKVPLKFLPEGVCRLTVLNEDFKPECERLIFVDKNQRFKIEVRPDSSSYGTRSKVTLLINTTDLGDKPVQTDLSLSVVDKEQITKDIGVSGICAYKLLESELQGNIEDAGFYFRDDSCTNREALDLLLLTQGYRKFLPAITKPDELKFQPEKTFYISGSLKFGGSKSREKRFNYRDIGLTLMCRSGNFHFDQSNPDSLGRFRFQVPLLSGKSPSLLQATTLKKKHFNGEISLDEPAPPPKFDLPILEVNKVSAPALEYVQRLQTFKKIEISKNPAYGTMTLNLPEVTVTAKAKNWYLNYDKEAKKIVNLDSLDPAGNKYNNLNDLLIREFGAKEYFIYPGSIKTILLPCNAMKINYWFPIYIINGQTYFNGEGIGEIFSFPLKILSSMKVNEIKRLMVLPPGNISYHYASSIVLHEMSIKQSLVVIETYSNNSYRGDPDGIKTFILDGLDAPRIFYSPHYEGQSRNSPVYDGRTTLYWESSLRTDTNGQAKVEFFTSDRQTSMEVIINGIEGGSGHPGQGKALINSTLKK